MAVLRNDPYRNFNFLVQIGGADPAQPAAGFFEVVLPSAEIAVAEYRAGNEPIASPRHLPGLTRYNNITLRRGLAGSLDLWNWFKSVRDGQPDRRDVTVTLLDEQRQPVMAWRLRNCIPVRYQGPTLNALGVAPALEEIELSVGSIDIE